MKKKYELVEIKLDKEILSQFTEGLQHAASTIVNSNLDKDSRIELLIVLLSFAGKIAQNLGIEDKSFVKLSKQFFADAEAEPASMDVPLDKSQIN